MGYEINALQMRSEYIKDFFRTGVLLVEEVCVNEQGSIFGTGRFRRVDPDWDKIRIILNSPSKWGWW